MIDDDFWLTNRQQFLIRKALEIAIYEAQPEDDASRSEFVETLKTFKEMYKWPALAVGNEVEAVGNEDPDPMTRILVHEIWATVGVIVALDGIESSPNGKFAVRWTDDYDEHPKEGAEYVPQENDHWYPVAAFRPFTHEDERGYGTENYPSGYVDIRLELS